MRVTTRYVQQDRNQRATCRSLLTYLWRTDVIRTRTTWSLDVVGDLLPNNCSTDDVSPKSQDADYEDATPPPAHSFLQVTAFASILQNPSETQPAHITSLNYISVANIILWPFNSLSLHLGALCSVQSTRFVSCRCSARIAYGTIANGTKAGRMMVFDRQL